MEPQAAIDLGISPSHRSFAGHVLSLGIHVFIFGALAYLTFVNRGGVSGQLLLTYVSALPLAMVIALVQVARAEQRIEAHHVIAGCLTGVVLCGLGGLWVAFSNQIAIGLVGSAAVVWITRYSPAARFLKPPTLRDLSGSTPLREMREVRTLVMMAGAVALLVCGIALTGLAVVGQMERPGGLTITYENGV
jgi:hypothetical protein